MINGFPEHNIHLLSIKHSKMLCKCTLLYTYFSSYQCGVVEVLFDFTAGSRVRTACVLSEKSHVSFPFIFYYRIRIDTSQVIYWGTQVTQLYITCTVYI